MQDNFYPVFQSSKYQSSQLSWLSGACKHARFQDCYYVFDLSHKRHMTSPLKPHYIKHWQLPDKDLSFLLQRTITAKSCNFIYKCFSVCILETVVNIEGKRFLTSTKYTKLNS